jgi:hypothetical protein
MEISQQRSLHSYHIPIKFFLKKLKGKENLSQNPYGIARDPRISK